MITDKPNNKLFLLKFNDVRNRINKDKAKRIKKILGLKIIIFCYHILQTLILFLVLQNMAYFLGLDRDTSFLPTTVLSNDLMSIKDNLKDF